ncbi:hypothetical protein AVEN_148119-1, partial [Araneus ventricosus]
MHHATEESQLALFRAYVEGYPHPPTPIYGPKPMAQNGCDEQKSLPPAPKS